MVDLCTFWCLDLAKNGGERLACEASHASGHFLPPFGYFGWFSKDMCYLTVSKNLQVATPASVWCHFVDLCPTLTQRFLPLVGLLGLFATFSWFVVSFGHFLMVVHLATNICAPPKVVHSLPPFSCNRFLQKEYMEGVRLSHWLSFPTVEATIAMCSGSVVS